MNRNSRRSIAAFNRIKFAPSRIKYAVAQEVTVAELLADAYQEVKKNGPIILENSHLAGL